MTESTEDQTLVHMNRLREHEFAKARGNVHVATKERVDFNALSAALTADVPFPEESAPAGTLSTAGAQGAGAAPGGGQPPVPSAHVAVPASPDAAGRNPDEGAAFRQTRIAITAGLVVLLLVVWIWQRTSASRR